MVGGEERRGGGFEVGVKERRKTKWKSVLYKT